MAAFTNCDITGAGPATVISSPVKSGDSPQTLLRFVNTHLSATGSRSPIFLLAKSDADIHLYNTKLTPSASNLIAATACYGALDISLTAGDCDPFSATFTISESKLNGDVEPRWPSTFVWALDTYTAWTGSVRMPGNSTVCPQINIFLDDTSTWNVTKES